MGNFRASLGCSAFFVLLSTRNMLSSPNLHDSDGRRHCPTPPPNCTHQHAHAPHKLKGSAEFYTAGGHADPQDASIFAYAFAEHCNNLTDGGFCATVGPQQGGAEGALLRLEAYLDTVSGTRPSAGLVHPRAMLFTTGSA